MAVFKCKMCGGSLEVKVGESVCTCEFCGSSQTVPGADSERKVSLFNRAASLRIRCEFDRAGAAYQAIASEFPEEAEAYWGMCLCKYGIEYVDDPRDGRRVPTCHRTLFDSILSDQDYLSALEKADVVARSVYVSEAEAIDSIQRRIISVSQTEEPYDIFICYKETGPDGGRTRDSVMAQDIYEKLEERGYRVFFARVTLENKLGQEYEPVIFGALRSAKVMLVIGTSEANFGAVWVRNEWSRFLSFMGEDKGKYIIPCFASMDAYDMPEELLPFQSQDMSKIGFVQDLARGIDKLFGRTETKKQNVADNTSVYFDRLDKALLSKLFDKAEWITEEILEINPKCSKAYLYKILIKRRLTSVDQLLVSRKPVDNDPDYLKALELATQSYRETLISYSDKIKSYIIRDKYDSAVEKMNLRDHAGAIDAFREIEYYEDASIKIKECQECIYSQKYNEALKLFNQKKYVDAIQRFSDLGDYRDSKQRIDFAKKELTIIGAKPKISSAIIALDSARFEQQINILETIKDYGNVKDLIDDYRQKFTNALDGKKKKDRKKKAIWITVASIVSFSCAFGVILGTVILPSSKYNEAMSLAKKGEYETAYYRFTSLEWKDSEEQALLARAGYYFQNGSYRSGISYICDAGGTVNISYISSEGKFDKSHDTVTSYESFKEATWTCDGYHLANYSVQSFSIGWESDNYVTELTLGVNKEITQYKITLNDAGKQSYIEYNITETVTIPNASRSGYDFDGWTGSGLAKATVGLSLPKGSFGDREYTAQYTAIKYPITYHLDGGNTTNPSTYTIEDKLVLSKATKTGYTFIGWFTDSTLSKEITIISSSTGSLHLYAKYAVNSYKYVFNANGGTMTNPKKTVEITYNFNNGKNAEVVKLYSGSQIPYKTPSYSKHIFEGWYKDSTLGLPFNWNESVSDDISLYAKWKEATYEVIQGTYSSSRTFEDDTNYTTNFIAGADCEYRFSVEFKWTSGSPSSTKTDSYVYYILSNQTRGGGAYDSITTSTPSVTLTACAGDVITLTLTPYSAYSSSIHLYRPKITYTFSVISTGESAERTAKVVLPETISSYQMEIQYGSSATIPIPKKDGAVFAGWSYNKYLLTQEEISKWEIGESCIFTAVWN